MVIVMVIVMRSLRITTNDVLEEFIGVHFDWVVQFDCVRPESTCELAGGY